MSIGNIVDTDPAKRTVEITSMAVQVNGTPVGELTDPNHIFPVDAGVPQLHVGDSVVVTVAVSNTTGTDLVPPTQVFLHVRHCRANRDDWFRIPMQNNGDGTWTHRVDRAPAGHRPDGGGCDRLGNPADPVRRQLPGEHLGLPVSRPALSPSRSRQRRPRS